MTMGNRIKELRLEKKLTQESLGVILGVQQSAIRKYEYNEVDLPKSKLQLLADYFDVSVDYLLGRTDWRNSKVREEHIIKDGGKMFANNLRYARKRRGLTLEQLADRHNDAFGGRLSKSTLSKYENDKREPRITVVHNLAKILQVSVDFLLESDTCTEERKVVVELNKNVLKSKMVLHGDKSDDLAKALGISHATMSYKLNGIKDFSQTEMAVIKRRYELTADEIDQIFL